MEQKFSDFCNKLIDTKNLAAAMDNAVHYCCDNTGACSHLYSLSSILSKKMESLFDDFEKFYQYYLRNKFF